MRQEEDIHFGIFGNVNLQCALSFDDSSGFRKMELSPGIDHSCDESDHETQQLISVGSSDMVVENKEDSERLYDDCIPDFAQDSSRDTSTEPHLPLVPNVVSGRRSKSRQVLLF
jgi:hypothetical protein